jgi:hypothetical protein
VNLPTILAVGYLALGLITAGFVWHVTEDEVRGELGFLPHPAAMLLASVALVVIVAAVVVAWPLFLVWVAVEVARNFRGGDRDASRK